MGEIAHLSAKAYGRVQGVCFRYFVLDTAKKLGLNGYVRNLPDGTAVETQAEGDTRKLETLLDQIRTGPPGAWVKEVNVDWSDYSGQFGDFDIRY